MPPIDRRRFLQALGVAATAAALPRGVFADADAAPPLPHTPVLADLHAHPWLDEWNKQTPLAKQYPLLVRSATPLLNETEIDWKRCHSVGVNLVCAAHYNAFDEGLSMPTDPFPGAIRHTRMMMDYFEERLDEKASGYAHLARTPGELRRMLAVPPDDERFRVAVVHAIEGGHALGGDVSHIAELAKRSVAYMTLAHFFDKGLVSAANAFPFFPDEGAPAPEVGLHPLGREVIAEMESHGVIVDVTHMTWTAVEETLKVATRPIMATHVGPRTLSNHPYNLVDEHIRQIVHDGGIVGVPLYPFVLSNFADSGVARKHGSLDDVMRAVRYIVKITGTHEQVAIGSDFGGYIVGPKDMDRLSQISRLRELLMDEFGDKEIVDDILARNAVRFLLKNWGTS